MRRVICALTVLALASPAFAADLDLDILRGSQPVGPATFTRWSGFYVGGQFGYTNGNAPFSTATPPGIGNALRETTLENEFNVSQWPTLGTANQTVPSFGGFVGYNTQWQDVVIGIEANVSRAAFSLQAPSTPIDRSSSVRTASALPTLSRSAVPARWPATISARCARAPATCSATSCPTDSPDWH